MDCLGCGDGMGGLVRCVWRYVIIDNEEMYISYM